MDREPSLPDYEKLGVFYLGREVPSGEPFLYDARHLTTHAVIVGMTGSGKTGLSIALLEEAAIDGVPAIVVDPKGDLGNLLLTFPELRGEDLAPWAPPGTDAAAEAARWREGLAAWGQDGARVRRLRASAEVTLYTPGSRAGQPLSILGSLAAPPAHERDDADLLGERVSNVATSLLGLVGLEAEPGKSREHVLVANILQRAWAAGEGLDLAALVARIQNPPFDRVGVLEVDAFFPKKERFALAVAYNALLAAPGFEAWLEGPPLDVADLLWTREGKPRISVLSIAHLDDKERMFFVSLLLGQVLTWMRAQPGTPSLRALLFMDECVGYFPPVANPPSKRPLLLLLKQARAFGLGVVLATQNPVDLDYKGLSNAGTWLLGRLQTERDKARVLDGLEGVAPGESARAFDRAQVDRTLAGLAKRQFYVHDVHADGPVVIESRFTLSYLRGPLTRAELKQLARPAPPGAPAPSAPAAPVAHGTVLMSAAGAAVERTAPMPAAAAPPGDAAAERPAIPSEIPQVFFPSAAPRPLYAPRVVGAARVEFTDARTGLDFAREVMFLVPLADGPIPVRWEDAKWTGALDVRALATAPLEGARFLAPPAPALLPRSYDAWSKELARWLARTQGVARFKVAGKNLFSTPNEDERAFRARVALLGREERDQKAAAIRDKYASKLASLEDRIRAKRDAVARGEDRVQAQHVSTALSAGSGLLGAFLGGGVRRGIHGAASAARSANQSARQKANVARDRASLAELVAKHEALAREAQQAIASAAATPDPASLPLETVVTKPKRGGVVVHLVGLAWVPG